MNTLVVRIPINDLETVRFLRSRVVAAEENLAVLKDELERAHSRMIGEASRACHKPVGNRCICPIITKYEELADGENILFFFEQ